MTTIFVWLISLMTRLPQNSIHICNWKKKIYNDNYCPELVPSEMADGTATMMASRNQLEQKHQIGFFFFKSLQIVPN